MTRTAGGDVRLAGAATASADIAVNATIAYLPAGYRPSVDVIRYIHTYANTVVRLRIKTNGQILTETPITNGTIITFGGLTFSAAGLQVAFSPMGLFTAGRVGLYLEAWRELLFQDSAGATAANTAGNPVALARRLAGTVDASQSTLAARTTLARHPRGGRRNIVHYSELMLSGTAGWNSAGFVATDQVVVGSIRGTAIEADMRQVAVYDRTNQAWIIPRTPWTAGDGRKAVTFTVPAGCNEANFYPATASSTKQMFTQTVSAQVVPGQTYTASWHAYGNSVGGVQVEAGGVATPYQLTVTAHNVTETGVADIWHLADDLVDDALVATLPAATYTRAWVTSAGAVTIQTGQALSGTEDVMRAERIAAVLYIDRGLTSEEASALTKYWDGLYK